MNDPARLVGSTSLAPAPYAHAVVIGAGASLSEVVRTTVHVASTDQHDLVAAWQVVHDAFAPHDPPSSLLGITTLGHPGHPGHPGQLVEVDAVAALPG